jgi:hypothetical protein
LRKIDIKQCTFTGYLPEDNESQPAKETIDNLDRQRLWYDYISCRKPVVIDGLVKDENWDGERWVSAAD